MSQAEAFKFLGLLGLLAILQLLANLDSCLKATCRLDCPDAAAIGGTGSDTVEVFVFSNSINLQISDVFFRAKVQGDRTIVRPSLF